MGIVQEPSVTQVAAVLGGLATVSFGSRPYRRVCTHVFLTNPAGGTATIYVGAFTANAAVSSTATGAVNDFTTPFAIPAGQPVYVQWNVAAIAGAYGTISCYREES